MGAFGNEGQVGPTGWFGVGNIGVGTVVGVGPAGGVGVGPVGWLGVGPIISSLSRSSSLPFPFPLNLTSWLKVPFRGIRNITFSSVQVSKSTLLFSHSLCFHSTSSFSLV